MLWYYCGLNFSRIYCWSISWDGSTSWDALFIFLHFIFSIYFQYQVSLRKVLPPRILFYILNLLFRYRLFFFGVSLGTVLPPGYSIYFLVLLFTLEYLLRWFYLLDTLFTFQFFSLLLSNPWDGSTSQLLFYFSILLFFFWVPVWHSQTLQLLFYFLVLTFSIYFQYLRFP